MPSTWQSMEHGYGYADGVADTVAKAEAILDNVLYEVLGSLDNDEYAAEIQFRFEAELEKAVS